MKFIGINTSKIVLTSMACALMLILGGCVNDSSSCPDIPAEEEDHAPFHLQFKIITRITDNESPKHQSPTRDADIDGEVLGSAYENYLDVNDIRYLIFDKSGYFLCDVTAKAKTVAVADSQYAVYDVTAPIDDKYFLDNIHGTVDFYILALANTKDWGITIPTLTRGTTNINSLFANDVLVLTTKPDTQQLQRATQTESGPYAPAKQLFPMSGLQHFQVPGNMLESSSDGMPYNLTLATGKALNLLRAFAKIEVIDKINIGDNVFNPDVDNEGEEGWCRIDKVEIDGYMNQGCLIPNESNWKRNETFETQQVLTSSIPLNAEYMTPTPLQNDGSYDVSGTGYPWGDCQIDFYEDKYASNLRQDKCPVYSCYLFEYSQSSDAMAKVDVLSQPYIRVTTRGYSYWDGNELVVKSPSLVRPFRIAEYTNGSATADNNLPALLRNHIYRFEIRSIGLGSGEESEDSKLEIAWTVCPMDRTTIDIPFN